jgi:hypothetical protein
MNPYSSFEEAQDAADMFSISSELTCTCDEFHICQQCHIMYEKLEEQTIRDIEEKK